MIVQLTVTQRNSTIVASETRAFDVSTIISPIRRDSGNTYSYFTVRTNTSIGLPGELVDYRVTQSLAAIEALVNDLVRLTVTSRDGRSLVTPAGLLVASEIMLFNIGKVAEGVWVSGSGATFLYCENPDVTPVSYIVSESVTAIVTQTAGGPGTGTVTSFSAGDFAPLFTTVEATPTTTPALSFTAITKAANLIFSGPTTGGAAAPNFRALVAADIPQAEFETLFGTQAVEAFASETNTTTLAHAPKANRHLFVYVDSGSGYILMVQGTDYTVAGAVITWTPALASLPVVVYYTY